MNKYKVITPLSRVTPEKGFQSFTHGDLIELEDAEAARMIEAGIIEKSPVVAKPAEESKPAKVERAEKIETAVMPEAEIEKAVKHGRKEK